MRIVENEPPDLAALAAEFLEPFVTWLQSVGCTAERFREVLRESSSFDDKAEALGITYAQFKEGIDSIGSLHLYAELLGVTKEDVVRGFESHRYLAPSWYIKLLEEAVSAHLGALLG